MYQRKFGSKVAAAWLVGLALGLLFIFWGTISPQEVAAQGHATATPILPQTDYSAPTPAPPLRNVIAISAEHEDTCALLDNGGVECWGSDTSSGAQNILGVNSAAAISSGGQHSCALLKDGSVACWGYNSDGQLGDGTTESSFDEAVRVKGLPDNVTAIGAGWSFTCAIADGEVWCWGENDSGQLGDGTTLNRESPKRVNGLGGKAIAVVAGSSHACALLEGGRVQCWGRGLQIDDTTQDRTTPVDIRGLGSDVVLIASEYWHTCALKSNGQVLCWGSNEFGQLGDGTTSDKSAPVAVQGLGGDITIVTTGYKHTCAANASGETFCWGDNRAGQLGNGANTDSTAPVKVNLDGPATGLSAGDDFSCAIVDSGVQCWGENRYHELGTGVSPDLETPTNVENLNGVTSIAAGGDTSCAITSNGVRCWGENENGQVGDGTDTDRDLPAAVTGLPGNVTDLAIGYVHSCALASGNVWCWGASYSGQLANEGIYVQSLTPLQANGLPPEIQSIDAGGNTTCALAGNNLWCWGENDNGQLGDGTTDRRESPVQVRGLTGKISSFSVGTEYACVVVNDGVLCWGNNRYGQLGDGTKEDRLTPTAVSGLGSGVASVIAGEQHTCAITSAGGVKCWGYNINGQLGDGTTEQHLTPIDVSGLSDKVSKLIIGYDFTCALTDKGGVKCWGSNSKVGNDTVSWGESSTPVDVLGLTSNVISIAAGRFHACAALADGTAKCWGTNWNGQLGNGEGPDSNVPITVVLGDRRYGEEQTNGFRNAGPLVPEITTYIPTPLDISAKPGVIGTNLLLAALMMLPFAIAAEIFTRTVGEHEEGLKKKFRPVEWISRLQKRLDEITGTKFSKRPAVQDTLKLIGVIVFYGLVFSLLDRTWKPFSLQGLVLFLSMTIAYGIVGIADDIIQWRAIRKWGLQADLTVRPTNFLLAMASTATSRLLAMVPGLMFGTPEALQTEEGQFDEKKRSSLLKISTITFVVIGLAVWLPTIATALLQKLPLSEGALNAIGGLEGFLLVIFAVTLENLFVQMLGFPGGFGQALKRRSKWLWVVVLTAVTFLFYHTLINPRGELADALKTGNVRLFLGVAIAFMIVAFGLRWYFNRKERRAGEPPKATPAPIVTATQPEVPPAAPPQPEPVAAAPVPIPILPQARPVEAQASTVVVSINEMKNCPICNNSIKAEAKICRFCKASFAIMIRGYCPTDHDVTETTADGKCTRCGGEVTDLHVESRLLSAPTATAQTMQAATPLSQAPTQTSGDTKPCPNCGQMIKSEALICRFCKTRLDVYVPPIAAKPAKKSSAGRVLLTILIALLAIAGCIFAVFYFTGGAQLMKPVETVTFDTIQQYEKERRVTIEGFLNLPFSTNCDDNCGLQLVDYEDPGKVLTVFVDVGGQNGIPEPNHMLRLPSRYEIDSLKVGLSGGGVAGDDASVILTGRVCETTGGDICLHVDQIAQGSIPPTPTPTLTPIPTATPRPTATPLPVQVDFTDVCSHVGVPVIIQGRISSLPMFMFCSGTCSLSMVDAGGSGKYLYFKIGRGSLPNQMEDLPNKYQDSDLRIHTNDGEIVGVNDLVILQGIIVSTFEATSDKQLGCEIELQWIKAVH